jgi:hypothetical protein
MKTSKYDKPQSAPGYARQATLQRHTSAFVVDEEGRLYVCAYGWMVPLLDIAEKDWAWVKTFRGRRHVHLPIEDAIAWLEDECHNDPAYARDINGSGVGGRELLAKFRQMKADYEAGEIVPE